MRSFNRVIFSSISRGSLMTTANGVRCLMRRWGEVITAGLLLWAEGWGLLAVDSLQTLPPTGVGSEIRWSLSSAAEWWGLLGSSYLKPQNPKASRELRSALSRSARNAKSQGHWMWRKRREGPPEKMAGIETVPRVWAAALDFSMKQGVWEVWLLIL